MKNKQTLFASTAILSILTLLAILGVFSNGRQFIRTYDVCQGTWDRKIYSSDLYLPNRGLDKATQELLRNFKKAPHFQNCIPAGTKTEINIDTRNTAIVIVIAIGLLSSVAYINNRNKQPDLP